MEDDKYDAELKTRRARRNCEYDLGGSTILCHRGECSNTSDNRYKWYSLSRVCLACDQLGDIDYAYHRRPAVSVRRRRSHLR